MPRFKTKPAFVEAMRYVGPEEDTSQTRADRQQLEDWGAPVMATAGWGDESPTQWELLLEDSTHETPQQVAVGDWVLREEIFDEHNEPDLRYFTMSNEDFQDIYEAVGG